MKIKISEKVKTQKITTAKAIASVIHKILKAEPKGERLKEHVWGVYLNTKLNIIRIELVSLGILDQSIVHPRETFAPAIECRASSLIVIHNHPSGDTNASEGDILITKQLKEAGEILGIELQDHIIINEMGKYLSFKDEGIIN